MDLGRLKGDTEASNEAGVKIVQKSKHWSIENKTERHGTTNIFFCKEFLQFIKILTFWYPWRQHLDDVNVENPICNKFSKKCFP
jgi:hypothetical protein